MKRARASRKHVGNVMLVAKAGRKRGGTKEDILVRQLRPRSFASTENMRESKKQRSSLPLSSTTEKATETHSAPFRKANPSNSAGTKVLALSTNVIHCAKEDRLVPPANTGRVDAGPLGQVAGTHIPSCTVQIPLPYGHRRSTGSQVVLMRPVDAGSASIIERAILTLQEIWPLDIIPPIFASRSQISTDSVVNDSSGSNAESTRVILAGSLVPIDVFVKDILARSRTTGAIMKLALEYIVDLKTKVLEAAAHAQSRGQLTVSAPSLSITRSAGCGSANYACAAIAADPQALDWLPSPLLCPRRVFLVAVILASKILEDVVLPNREWAKLSGLPCNEIFRCERIVGEALQLWRPGRVDHDAQA